AHALRTARHPRQQRRRQRLPSAAGDQRRGMAALLLDRPRRSLAHGESGVADDDRRRRRVHHQHRLGARLQHHPRLLSLPGREARPARPHARPRRRIRRAGRAGERDRPRLYRDPDRPGLLEHVPRSGGGAETRLRSPSAEAGRPAGGGRDDCGVPRFRRSAVHQRRVHRHRWGTFGAIPRLSSRHEAEETKGREAKMTSSTISGGIALAAMLLAFAGAARADELKIGYINKMGDHPWFVAEVAGAKAEAEKLGAKISVQDVQFNADLTLTTLDAMIGDGVKGVAIVVPDRALGPVVAEKAAKANVKLIAVDDDIKG